MTTKKHAILLITSLYVSIASTAHPIDSLLKSVERNNITLKALDKSNQAEIISAKSDNNLGETSIDYSPFYASGITGVASSELVVSQSFDFPTLYTARSKANAMKANELDQLYKVARRDILVSAKTLCLDIIHMRKLQDLLNKRAETADRLLTLFEKRANLGDATAIELNKVKMERMEINAQKEELNSVLKSAEAQLIAINGNQPTNFQCTSYPEAPVLADDNTLIENFANNDGEVLLADAQAKTSKHNINISKQGWLPKLSVGYRRNTNLDEAVNGFLIGASIPLFTNRNKTKEAKIAHESKMDELEDVRTQSISEIRTLIAEVRHTQKAISSYDTTLMESSLTLLGKAVEAGEMTATDYYREADNIYANMTRRLELENKLHKSITLITKNDI